VADPIRILLVDDHAMVRRGLREFLGLFEDLEVVAEARDGEAALAAVAASTPDVVVMDLVLPVLDGVAATAGITAAYPTVQVVALTAFVEEERVTAAIEAGASGFLLKTADADEVAAAIRAAYAGEMYLDPAIAAIVARRARTRSTAPPDTGAATLTSRESEVLALVAHGHSNRVIGDRLGITERTARTHVSNILAKLRLSSRTQAALYAVERGLDRPR
jgi:DNA-binding NarL/FixJ family response regulator